MENQKTIGEMAAEDIIPARTQNIADLPQVSVDLKISTEEFKTKEGEPFTVNSVEVEGVKYRVPNSVLTQLKVLKEDNPKMTVFKVKKTGTGLDTEYLVIPVIN